MTRRGRAVGFLLLALLAAGGAAAIAEGYGSSVARGYGPLRAVVVAKAPLRPGMPIGPEVIAHGIAVRRVPERFVPTGALLSPAEAVGLMPQAALPVGAYLLADQLRPPRPRASVPSGLRGRRAVEISVSGADALLAGAGHVGAKVDVVVTTEPSGPGPGRTYVAAGDVPLLGLSPEPEGAATGGMAVATLALGKREALRLIEAESFARRVTLLPQAG